MVRYIHPFTEHDNQLRLLVVMVVVVILVVVVVAAAAVPIHRVCQRVSVVDQ